MSALEEANIARQNGLLSYCDGNNVIRLKAESQTIPSSCYSGLRRECNYMEGKKASLLLFCDAATAICKCGGIYCVQNKIHLDNQWFADQNELAKYLESKEVISPEFYQALVELLDCGDVDQIQSRFTEVTGAHLIVEDGKFKCCGQTFNNLTTFRDYFERRKPADFEAMCAQCSTSRYVQDEQAVIFDEVAYLASNKEVYDACKENLPLKGYVGKDGTPKWLSVDRSKFQSYKTDHGDCFILKTLYKKSVTTIYAYVLKTDLFVKTRPYPIGILPDGRYSYSFKGQDGRDIDAEDTKDDRPGSK